MYFHLKKYLKKNNKNIDEHRFKFFKINSRLNTQLT